MKIRTLVILAIMLAGCGDSDSGSSGGNFSGPGPVPSVQPQGSPAVPPRTLSVPNFGGDQVATLIMRNVPTGQDGNPVTVSATASNRVQPEEPIRDLSADVMERELEAMKAVRGKSFGEEIRPRFQELPEGAQQNFFVAQTSRNVTTRKMNSESETIHCTIFAEVRGDGTPVISKGTALQIAQAWDLNNPFRPGGGIYDQTRAVFGSEWVEGGGRDGDVKVNLVLLSASSIGGANLFGFFRPSDELPRSQVSTSNEGEILYLNADKAVGDLFDLLSTAAHEFQHLADWNIKFGHNGRLDGTTEDPTINEGQSVLAEDLLGYGLNAQGGANSFVYNVCDQYLRRTADQPFFDFDDSQASYGKGYLLFRYINDRFGTNAVTNIATSPSTGLANIQSRLGVSFRSLFDDWTMTNLVSPLAGAPAELQYSGFTTTSTFNVRGLGNRTLPGVVPQTTSAPPGGQANRNLEPWSAYYAEYSRGTGNTLTIAIDQSLNTDANLVLQSPRGTFAGRQ